MSVAGYEENSSFMVWPESRRVSDTVLVRWAMDVVENGECHLNPLPALTDLQLNPALAREVLEDAGKATFAARHILQKAGAA